MLFLEIHNLRHKVGEVEEKVIMEDMELSLPLPEDPYLWISIFQHLRWKDLLGSVSLVCKFWHALSKDDLLRSHIGIVLLPCQLFALSPPRCAAVTTTSQTAT